MTTRRAVLLIIALWAALMLACDGESPDEAKGRRNEYNHCQDNWGDNCGRILTPGAGGAM